MKPQLHEITELILSSVMLITQGWHLEVVATLDTKLIDELGFSSLEFIDLLSTLETRLQHKVPYDRLMIHEDGSYRQELTIKELAAFVEENYDVPRENPVAP